MVEILGLVVAVGSVAATVFHQEIRTWTKQRLRGRQESSAPLALGRPEPSPPGSPPDVDGLHLENHDFIGRDHELRILDDLVSNRVRIITITAYGGMGKTRLAREFGARRRELFPGGVWFADLTDTISFVGVSEAIARALGVDLIGDMAGTELLHRKLSDTSRPALLILDNFETVLDGDFSAEALSLLENWAQTLSCVTFLVTSRTGIGLPLEREYRLGSLQYEAEEARDPASVGALPALRLFLAHATAADPAFKLTKENYRTVQNICRRLGGMPLGIALAASHVLSLSCRQLAEQLYQAIRVDGDVVSNAVEWSVNRLGAEDRETLLQLAIFRGGWDLPAMTAVVDTGAVQTLDKSHRSLRNLIGFHLVLPESLDGSAERRYTLPEPIREYLADTLASRPQRPLEERWISYYLDLKRRLEESTATPGEALHRLYRRDLENMLGVHSLLLARSDAVRAGIAILSVVETLERIGPEQHRIPHLRKSLSAFDSTEHMVATQVKVELSRALWSAGEWNEAGLLAQEAVKEARLHDSGLLLGRALLQRGRMLQNRGFLIRANEVLEEAAHQFSESGHTGLLGNTLMVIAATYDRLGRWDDSRFWLNEASKYFPVDAVGDRAMLANRRGLGHWHHLELTRALEELEESERLAIEAGLVAWPPATRTNQALVLTDLKEYGKAIRLFERSATEHERTGYRAFSAVNAGGWGRAVLEQSPGDPAAITRAIALFEEAKARAVQVHYPESIAMHAGDLARAYLQVGDARKGYMEARRAVALERTMGARADHRHFSNLVTLARAASALAGEFDHPPLQMERWEALERARRLGLNLRLWEHRDLSRIDYDWDHLEKQHRVSGAPGGTLDKVSFPLPTRGSIGASIDPVRLLSALDERMETSGFEYPWLGMEEELAAGGLDEILLFGYGSLVSLASAKGTYPSLTENDLVPAVAFGARRVFDYDMPAVVRSRSAHRMAAPSRRSALLNAHVSGLVTDCPNGVLMRVALSDIDALRRREVGYDLRPILAVPWSAASSAIHDVWVLGCTGRDWEGRPLTNPELLPHEGYGGICRDGAAAFGEEFLGRWLASTYLADAITPLSLGAGEGGSGLLPT